MGQHSLKSFTSTLNILHDPSSVDLYSSNKLLQIGWTDPRTKKPRVKKYYFSHLQRILQNSVGGPHYIYLDADLKTGPRGYRQFGEFLLLEFSEQAHQIEFVSELREAMDAIPIIISSDDIEEAMGWSCEKSQPGDAQHTSCLEEPDRNKNGLPYVAPQSSLADNKRTSPQYVTEASFCFDLDVARPSPTSKSGNPSYPDYEDVVFPPTQQQLGDAAPFKCLIGRKRKAFYMFREQARAQSTLLDEKLVVKKEESQDFGEDEIYLDEDEVDFQVFVSWLYHKKLPTDLFASTSNPITLRMSSLYAMAHRLGAKSFKNTLMDMFCHLAKPGKLAVPVSRLLSHPMDLRCTPLHGIYIQHLIRVIHNLDIKPELTYKGLTHDLKAANGNTSPEAAAIFTDIVLAMMETCRNRGVVETWAGWGFHDHDNNQELCYAPECIERRKKLEAEAKSGTVAAGGEANAKDSTK